MVLSRNAPCPCGSGKKFKRCCIGVLKGAEAVRSASSEPLEIAENRVFARYFDLENRRQIIVSNDVLFNQLNRDCPRIASEFDLLCKAELHWLNDEVCRITGTLTAAMTNVSADDARARIALAQFTLLQNSVQTLIAALEILRRGFRLQPGILMRNILECLATVSHLVIHEGDFKNLEDGTFSSTKAIRSASAVIPPFGRMYGLLSEEFIHVGSLHHRQPNPIKSFTRDEEALQLNLNFLGSTAWLIGVVAEFAFLDSIASPRVFTRLDEGRIIFALSDTERARLGRFLEMVEENHP